MTLGAVGLAVHAWLKRGADMGDTLKAIGLITTFLAVMVAAMLAVQWWDSTWRAAVEPTRASIYQARLGPSRCVPDWMLWWWRENGCRLI